MEYLIEFDTGPKVRLPSRNAALSWLRSRYPGLRLCAHDPRDPEGVHRTWFYAPGYAGVVVSADWAGSW